MSSFWSSQKVLWVYCQPQEGYRSERNRRRRGASNCHSGTFHASRGPFLVQARAREAEECTIFVQVLEFLVEQVLVTVKKKVPEIVNNK